MESFDLNIDNLEPISLDFESGTKSFGGGAEFLMNVKKTTPQNSEKQASPPLGRSVMSQEEATTMK
jgi:hypothetical protein